MEEKLRQILKEARAEILSADSSNYEQLRIKYLGRKSALSVLLRGIKDLPEAGRKELGELGNRVKREVTQLLADLKVKSSGDQTQPSFDPTIPGIAPELGRLHPITQMIDDLIEFFRGLGFSVAEGPEVELEKYNFDLLNIPDNHPARDEWDTFWIKRREGAKDNTLLRTHTSPVQLRYMQEHKPPVRIIAPGRTFRYESEDATHGSVFYQLEGLMIDKNITVAHLKGTIDVLVKRILGESVKTRLRPSFFPFTEPSFEVDAWFNDKWLELMGCGMVHPQVLKNGNIDPEQYSGFAFGMGIERLIMLKYGIGDMRYFYQPNLDFLKQF